jgi:hypothetical protein
VFALGNILYTTDGYYFQIQSFDDSTHMTLKNIFSDNNVNGVDSSIGAIQTSNFILVKA